MPPRYGVHPRDTRASQVECLWESRYGNLFQSRPEFNCGSMFSTGWLLPTRDLSMLDGRPIYGIYYIYIYIYI